MRSFRHQLVETTVLRGRMHEELVKKFRKKTANPQPALEVQADIHFQAVMGDQFEKYDTAEKKVQAFNLIYSPFPVVMNEVQEQQFVRMLKEEHHHPGKYPVYAGTDASIAFWTDILSEFRGQIELQDTENFIVLRAHDDPFNYQDVTDFMARNNFDRSAYYGLFGLSVNAFPFGGTSCWEATYYYFLQNFSQEHQNIKEFFDEFFQRLKINADFSIFEKIYEEFAKTMGGALYQIFIDASRVDQLVKPATLNGKENPLSADNGKLNHFSVAMKEMRANPRKHAEYIQTFQARVYLDPQSLHDKEVVEILTYRLNPLTPEQQQKYRKALTAAVTEHLVKPLLIRYQRLPTTAFARAKGKPGLHRQMGMVYQANGIEESEKPDVTILIPELIAEGNINGLIKFIVETPDFDLKKKLYDIKHLHQPPTLLDLFEKNLGLSSQLYFELQQYKDKYPVANVLQKLTPIVLYHAISIGNLDLAKKLFQEALIRDTKYLTKDEIFFVENYPEMYREKLFRTGLAVAATNNQGEIFDWLWQESQKYNFEPSDICDLSSKGVLKIAIERGYCKIVERILSISKISKLTALHFNEMLLLAKKHNQFEVISVILERLMTMSKESVAMVLMQKNSILIYLNDNKQEAILKKLNFSLEKLTSDPRVMISELLLQGNVTDLVEVIASAENFDLSCSLIAEEGSSTRTLLDHFGDHIAVSAQVFIGLQQHKGKEHVSLALQQLQSIAWYHSVCIGNLSKVEELLEAEHNDRNDRLYKALKLAAEHNQPDVLAWLLEKYQNFKPGYNILSQVWPSSPLGIAIIKGHQQIIERVWFSVNEKTPDENDIRSLLSLATTHDRLEIIEFILDKIKNISRDSLKRLLITKNDYSLLCHLVEKGHDQIINKLLNDHQWLSELLNEVTNKDGKKLLIIAIENHQINLLAAFLASNSSERSNFFNEGISPLILAAKRNAIEIMKILLNYTDRFYEKDQYRKTALMVAAELGYCEIVSLLLNHPIIKGNTYICEDYLSKKTEPGSLDALALAAKNGHLEVTKLLLSYPVFDLMAALQQAAKFGHREVFELIADKSDSKELDASSGNRFLLWSERKTADRSETQLEKFQTECKQ